MYKSRTTQLKVRKLHAKEERLWSLGAGFKSQFPDTIY